MFDNLFTYRQSNKNFLVKLFNTFSTAKINLKEILKVKKPIITRYKFKNYWESLKFKILSKFIKFNFLFLF